MKRLFAILCASSQLYSASPDGTINELEELSLDTKHSQEIAALDPNTLIQQPISPEEMQLPAPTFAMPYKNPVAASIFSCLIPGLGHVYLGDMKTASGIFGTASLTAGIGLYSSPDTSLKLTSFVTAQNTIAYGIYAAYRDARIYNGQSGYSYKMPTDSLTDLASAPFKMSVLKKPEVWGGLLGAFAIGFAVNRFAFSEEARIQTTLSSKMALSPLAALPIGIGEEALFRGFLQSQLSETFTPWGGIVLSSLAFGAVHIPNALALEPEYRSRYYTFSLPLITGLGTYFGWLTYKNRSLKESVAVHTWYDFILFAGSALASQAMITGCTEFAMDIPF